MKLLVTDETISVPHIFETWHRSYNICAGRYLKLQGGQIFETFVVVGGRHQKRTERKQSEIYLEKRIGDECENCHRNVIQMRDFSVVEM